MRHPFRLNDSKDPLAAAGRPFENTACLVGVFKLQCSRHDQKCDFLDEALWRRSNMTKMLAHGKERITNSNAVNAYDD